MTFAMFDVMLCLANESLLSEKVLRQIYVECNDWFPHEDEWNRAIAMITIIAKRAQ
jgi:hypothetical protein